MRWNGIRLWRISTASSSAARSRWIPRSHGASDFDAFDTDFRNDFRTRYAGSGGATYEQYQPAYRYGYGLAANPRYIGQDWNAMEPEVRRDWEARHAGPQPPPPAALPPLPPRPPRPNRRRCSER